MASTIDIFNSKLDTTKIVGENKFFNNTKEIVEADKLQQKYISSVDYSSASNFARFGSAEEYYKNAINYISADYKHDSSTADKLEWINSLNEFEYYIYKNEYPRAVGHVTLTGSQSIKAYSHVQDPSIETREVYETNSKLCENTHINLEDGITYEGWYKFNEDTNNTNVVTISTISGSGASVAYDTFIKILREQGPDRKFIITNDDDIYYELNYTVENDKWHHYAFQLNSSSISLFVDGKLTEELNDTPLSNKFSSLTFARSGLVVDIPGGNPAFDDDERYVVYEIGGGASVSCDEIRVWNGKRSVEKIGRYWFTTVDGNDFNDLDNSNLLLYYKFNEGWDLENQFLCLDSSGRQNDGEIYNYDTSCRVSSSGIDLSGITTDTEQPDIIVRGLKFSETVKSYYSASLDKGITHDEDNGHMLYKKFPAWILMEEESKGTKHLKQIIQIISMYFDDLYNKITELSEYKAIKYGQESEKIYPFYDKILTSAGFDVSDLFNNLDIVEKISSRSDINIFDEEIQKLKNSIFQNIYNNLAYILKSKGTEKSIKSLLYAYGINEKLVKINLYPDDAEYHVADRLRETIAKKKTLTLSGDSSIYLSSESIHEDDNFHKYTLETSLIFPKKYENYNILTCSLFGLQNNSGSSEISWGNNNYHYYVTLENDENYGSVFVLTDTIGNSSTSSYIKNIYDDSVWNLSLRKTPACDTLNGLQTTPTYNIELYGINTNRPVAQEFSCSLPYSYGDGYLRYYIGARKNDLTGSTIYEANSKYLYCNFWTDYLNNEVITSHNRDILNYGVDE